VSQPERFNTYSSVDVPAGKLPDVPRVFVSHRNFDKPLAEAVTALLAGELEGGWKVYWRMRLFFLIVKIHSRWPILPNICFEDKPAESRAPQFVHPSSDPMMEQTVKQL